ncbi:tyrosine-type recombinase/integrase [Alicyclobacillus macrosporangiidus]|uniref:tyrosine-type recombinase/integrase n=1 Tax=Alicyclobacillus macrosporangiidus TaxID=392015 RepID=UPI0004974D11|nr:tyrosine-type recombinase/integrase [Alicyclobacillus macrosporangiidus]
MLLEDVFKKFTSYLRLERDFSKATVIAYRRDFHDFLEFLSRENIDPELENITTPMIRDYVVYLSEEHNLSPNSIRRKLNSLRSFFKYATTQEYISKNPALPVVPPKKKKVLPVYIPADELRKLLNAPMQQGRSRTWLRDKLILETFAFTGIRRQELINLEWRDINFREGTLKVRSGKGDKDRLIPLPPQLLRDLEMFKSMQDVSDFTPVFRSVNGRRLTPWPLRRLFERYIKLAGLEGKGYTIHKMRHSYATLLMQQGVDVTTIQELLGHADLTATKIYIHTDAVHLRNSIMKHPLLQDDVFASTTT